MKQKATKNLIVFKENLCKCGNYKLLESKQCRGCKGKNKTNLSKTLSFKNEIYQKHLQNKRIQK